MAGFLGQNPRLFTPGQSKPLPIDGTPPRNAKSSKRHSPWLQACQGGEPSPGNVLNAGAITDAVNLGTVALRTGQKVLFDSENMKITNITEANKYLVREYRQGWEL